MDRRTEPTPESTWQAATGSPITDALLEWPPDLFALTDVILDRSQTYRFLLSGPDGVAWPPSCIPRWSDAVEEAAREWCVWVGNGRGVVPDLLAEEWRVFRERASMSLEHLAAGHDWRMCEALLTAHAIADEACAGLGGALGRMEGVASTALAAASCWREKDRLLELIHNSCACCPRSGPHPMEPL